MKLKYQAPKNSRIKTRFMSVTTYGRRNLWYHEPTKQWTTDPTVLKGGYFSNFMPCRSVKAFRRFLKKAPKGIEWILISRYVGHDVYAKT